MACSSLHPHLHPTFSFFHHTRPSTTILLRKNSRNRRRSMAAASSSWEAEESRWLREEQRWMREEQRWMREEARWKAERESLLHEIANLRTKLEKTSADERTVSLEMLLRALKERAAPPSLPEEGEVKEIVLEGLVGKGAEVGRASEEERRTLKKGSEGEDVRVMQEALEKIGFYSTEEDMEYHIFPDGTDRAVKACQSSLGVQEDGIMTSDLLKVLYSDTNGVGSGFERKVDGGREDEPNGVTIASVKGINESQPAVRKDINNKKAQVSPHKVFLLGENRWEEPSRLAGKDRLVSGSNDSSLVKCLSCRGEGRLMCTECDGTGEPNIEPQFMEWVDEGTKCPYCEGLGYTICDVCEGNTLVEKNYGNRQA